MTRAGVAIGLLALPVLAGGVLLIVGRDDDGGALPEVVATAPQLRAAPVRFAVRGGVRYAQTTVDARFVLLGIDRGRLRLAYQHGACRLPDGRPALRRRAGGGELRVRQTLVIPERSTVLRTGAQPGCLFFERSRKLTVRLPRGWSARAGWRAGAPLRTALTFDVR